MNKSIKSIIACALVVFSITSCSKKNDTTTDLSTLTFANETVDQGKTSLTNAGTQFITETQAMNNASGMEAIHSFVDLNTTSPTLLKSAPFFQPLTALAAADQNITAVVKSMTDASSEPTTFTEAFNSNTGIYTWNFKSATWDITASTTVLQFNFPHKSGGTTNDAQLTVTYTGVTPKNAVTSYTGDLPKLFDISILVSGAKVAGYNFSASYSDDGVPISMTSYIQVTPFKIGVEWAYSTANVSVKYYFTDNNKTVLEYGANTGGNFAPNYLISATTIDNVVDNANAYFQIFNVKLAGQIDYKSLNADIKNITGITTDSALYTKEAELMNKHALLVLIYADSKLKIAQAEAYAVKRTQYNPYSSGFQLTTKWSTEMRFVFADKSKGDLKTYFSTGFSELQTNFNDLVTDLKTKYGN